MIAARLIAIGFDRAAKLPNSAEDHSPRTRLLPQPIDLFSIRAHVPHFAECVVDYHASSAATRATLPARIDVAYGEGPDENLDLFFPDPAFSTGPAPVHLFIHGGYWRANSKNDYSFVADSIVAQGAIAAILDYSLMPGARMGALVDQVRRSRGNQRKRPFGGRPSRQLSRLPRAARSRGSAHFRPLGAGGQRPL
jgi:acetyl esterase/lipase